MSFLVVIEQRKGVIRNASVEVWRNVQHLAAISGQRDVAGVIAGDVDRDHIRQRCFGKGTIYTLRQKGLHDYSPQAYTESILHIVDRIGAESVFLANTAMGRDLAPRLAMRMDASLASDCIVGHDESGLLKAETRMYAGTVSVVIQGLRNRTVYSMAPGICRPEGPAENAVAVVDEDGISVSESNPVLQKIVYHTGRKDIAESDIVVAGGRGIGSSENFALLESLAAALDGAVGASRSAVDEGWRPHSDQIGQTGKSIAPRLYIACGISGAPQHLAGISGAETVVAINRDGEAPIFKVADYGIVGDIAEVLPDLEQAVLDLQREK